MVEPRGGVPADRVDQRKTRDSAAEREEGAGDRADRVARTPDLVLGLKEQAHRHVEGDGVVRHGRRDGNVALRRRLGVGCRIRTGNGLRPPSARAGRSGLLGRHRLFTPARLELRRPAGTDRRRCPGALGTSQCGMSEPVVSWGYRGGGGRPTTCSARWWRSRRLGDRLTKEELLTTATLLFAAGFETTTHLLGNGLVALLCHPTN